MNDIHHRSNLQIYMCALCCRVRLLRLDAANSWEEEIHDLTLACPHHQPRVVTSRGVYINGDNSDDLLNPLPEFSLLDILRYYCISRRPLR